MTILSLSLLSFTPATPSRHLINLSTLSIVRRQRHLNSSPSPLSHLQILYRPPPHAAAAAAAAYHPPPRASLSTRALPAGAEDLLQDAGATVLVLAGAYALVLAFDNLTQRNLLQQIILFFLWYLTSTVLSIFELKQKIGAYIVWAALHAFLANFQNSTSTEARYFASLVPLVNCLRLLLHGLSLVTNEGLVKSVTREGNPEELLRGPLYYVLILILCAIVFWRESPVGLISLAMMCGGDGVADIMGRKFGSTKIPYNQKKSWAGSISMFLFGFLVSIGMLYYYSYLGYFQLNWVQTVEKVALVSLVATVVESLPITEVIDDNISVPLASMVAAYLSFSL